MQEAAEALEAACHKCRLPASEASHRRGDYFCLHSGVSMGSGQTKPMKMDDAYNATNRCILDKLNCMGSFERLGGFSTGK